MDPNSEILDISSDEDGNLGDDNFDWIYKMLADDDETEESDDVVVVGEKQNFETSDGVKPGFMDDLDDDCLILDGDPDNPVAVVDDKADGSDELSIVGEKGQLACRDYPHPRHLCANFPFSSTSHEKYCDLCHCYVCDLRAPCTYWGTDVSTDDHCHSTDKEERWKVKRKLCKQGKLEAPGQKLLDTTLSPLPNQAPPATPLETTGSSFVPALPISGLTPSQAFLSMSRSCMPNIIEQRNNQSPRLILRRNRFPLHVSISQPMSVTTVISRRVRARNVGSLGAQISPQMQFKRVGSARSTNQSGNSPSTNNNHVYTSQQQSNQHPEVMPNDEIGMRWQDFVMGMDSDLGNCQSSSEPFTGSNFSDLLSNTIPQPQVYGQPIPQSHENQNLYSHENPTLNAANPSVTDFNFDWMTSTTQSIQHPPALGSELQRVHPTSDLPPVTESNSQYIRNADTGSLDYHLGENWIYTPEYPSAWGTTEDSVPSELNFVTPQPSSLDPATLICDFESHWSSLAHV